MGDGVLRRERLENDDEVGGGEEADVGSLISK